MAPAVRQVWRRDGVGLAADLQQWQRLRTERISIRLPTLVLLRRGTKLIANGRDITRAVAGQIAILPVGVFDLVNEPEGHSPYEASSLSIHMESVSQHSPGRFLKTGGGASTATLGRDFQEAFVRAHRGIRADDVPLEVARHRVLEVLEWLRCEGYGFPHQQPRSTAERVRDLIMARPDHDWSADAVAAELCMSEPTLRRRLQAQGESFTAILFDVRMSHALWLLQSTSMPIVQVALSSGYESHSRFSSRFRERFGFTPSAVRNPAVGARSTENAEPMSHAV